MNKHTFRIAAGLAALLPALVAPAVMADGNVWVNQPHGGYAPQGYVPQAAANSWMNQGMGFGMGMSMNFNGHGGMAPAYGQGYAPAMPPWPVASAQPYGPQPAWPVPPEHPAWPNGYPGIAPGMAPAAPAMTSGVPWPAR